VTINRRQYPHCTETKSPIALRTSARLPQRHPRHSNRCCISIDEFKERVWELLARNPELTVDQAHARALVKWRPVKRGKRVNDELALQRAKRRITPLEAQRRALNYMQGRYSMARGAKGPPRRHGKGCDWTTARAFVIAEFCVMGTWEDLQAYGDACSIHWQPWGF